MGDNDKLIQNLISLTTKNWSFLLLHFKIVPFGYFGGRVLFLFKLFLLLKWLVSKFRTLILSYLQIQRSLQASNSKLGTQIIRDY